MNKSSRWPFHFSAAPVAASQIQDTSIAPKRRYLAWHFRSDIPDFIDFQSLLKLTEPISLRAQKPLLRRRYGRDHRELPEPLKLTFSIHQTFARPIGSNLGRRRSSSFGLRVVRAAWCCSKSVTHQDDRTKMVAAPPYFPTRGKDLYL